NPARILTMSDQIHGKSAKGLHLWALLTLAATLLLIASGGIVTSKGVGMSVPDWPTTYGYNMFLFPFSQWVGGIFYEHSHRLIASGVGLMTMILAAWVLAADSRRWVKILAVAVFLAVCLQGLLGGLRVTLYKNEIGIFHALLAQSFLCALAVLAVATSARFLRGEWDVFHPDPILRNLVLATTVLIFFQLGLGATMRHEHAGLSIPDFPLAYGKWIPDTSAGALESINAARTANSQVPTNVLFIWVQMVHRAMAVLILAGVVATFRRAATSSRLRVTKAWSAAWLALVIAQVLLGAWTIWSDKAADIATTHMAVGALTLLLGVVFSFRLCRAAGAHRFYFPDPQFSRELASRTA
ncbi:MAG: COX15/CtaA family protein, partial [Terrimicrobiaceae bacterium]